MMMAWNLAFFSITLRGRTDGYDYFDDSLLGFMVGDLEGRVVGLEPGLRHGYLTQS